MKTIFVAINSKYVHSALGLRYIEAASKKQGFETLLLEDSINTPILTVLAKISELRPDNIGFSVHIWNRNYVKDLVELVRKVLPTSNIIIGGPEVMFDGIKGLNDFPEANYLVQGEGEEVIVNLLSYLENKSLKTEIPSFVAYRTSEGEICTSENLAIVEDMDNLEFPYPDLEEVIANHKIAYYECTRGCPFNCSYCLSGISRRIRKRSLEKVYADLDRFLAAGIPLLKFVDRTYNLDEEYFLPIMKYLAKANTEAVFHFEIKADLLSQAVIEFLKTVPKGRFQFEIGVQSTNQDTLTAICRQDDWKQLTENVEAILEMDTIHIHMDLIAGLPYEGLREFGKSFDDVYSLNPHMLQLGFLKVLPGTLMEKQKEEHQLVYMANAPYEILKTKYMSYDDLKFLKVLEDVFDHLYNSEKFPYIIKYLVSAYSSPFVFYSEFTKWWITKGLFGVGHKSSSVAKYIWEYIKENHPENEVVLLELLRFDVLVNQPTVKDEWLMWNTAKNFEIVSKFWSEEEQVKAYLPDYKFKNWREIHKNYPVEEFSYNPFTNKLEQVYFMVDRYKEVVKVINLAKI